MSQITKVEFWKDIKFQEGTVEVPKFDDTLPTPDETFTDSIKTSTGDFFSNMTIPVVFKDYMCMSYMRVTYDFNNDDTPLVLYGWIDDISLKSDTENNPSVSIAWHVDLWRTYASSATYGYGMITRRPSKMVDADENVPVNVCPNRYTRTSADIKIIPGCYAIKSEDADAEYVGPEVWNSMHGLVKHIDPDVGFESLWVIINRAVEGEKEVEGGDSKYHFTEIRSMVMPVSRDVGENIYFKLTEDSDLLTAPSLSDFISGRFDEILGVPPSSITGAFITTIPPLHVWSGTGKINDPYIFTSKQVDEYGTRTYSGSGKQLPIITNIYRKGDIIPGIGGNQYVELQDGTSIRMEDLVEHPISALGGYYVTPDLLEYPVNIHLTTSDGTVHTATSDECVFAINVDTLVRRLAGDAAYESMHDVQVRFNMGEIVTKVRYRCTPEHFDDLDPEWANYKFEMWANTEDADFTVLEYSSRGSIHNGIYDERRFAGILLFHGDPTDLVMTVQGYGLFSGIDAVATRKIGSNYFGYVYSQVGKYYEHPIYFESAAPYVYNIHASYHTESSYYTKKQGGKSSYITRVVPCSNNYYTIVMRDVDTTVVGSMRWRDEATDPLIAEETYGLATVRTVISPSAAYVQFRMNGYNSSLIGETITVPMHTLDISGNSWSEYVMSGERDYMAESKRIANEQALAQNLFGALTGGTQSGVMGSLGTSTRTTTKGPTTETSTMEYRNPKTGRMNIGERLTTTTAATTSTSVVRGMGGGAAFAATAGIGVATALGQYALDLYHSDQLIKAEDKYQANKIDSITIPGNGVDWLFNGTKYNIIGYSMCVLIPDDYSVKKYNKDIELNGLDVSEPTDDFTSYVTKGGPLQVINAVIGGDIPVQARQHIRAKLAAGVRIIKRNGISD